MQDGLNSLERLVVQATEALRKGHLFHPLVGAVGVQIDGWTQKGFLDEGFRQAYRQAGEEVGARLALSEVVQTSAGNTEAKRALLAARNAGRPVGAADGLARARDSLTGGAGARSEDVAGRGPGVRGRPGESVRAPGGEERSDARRGRGRARKE